MTGTSTTRRTIRELLSSVVQVSPEITDESKRRTAQIGMVLQLAILAVFLSTNILRWLSIVDAPVPEWAYLSVFGTYLLSRTKYFRYGIAIFIIIVNMLPYYILISFQVTDSQRIFTALIWVPLFVLLASFLMGIRETTLITIANSFVVIFLPLYITDMSLIDLGYLISYTVTLSITIIVGSLLRERYLEKITKQKGDLTKQMEEIEFFVDLMVHDFTNINQAIGGRLELILRDESDSLTRSKMIHDGLDQLNRSTKLITCVKKITQLENKTPSLGPISLVDTMNDVLFKVRSEYPNKTLVITDGIDRENQIVPADEYLEDVFYCLLDNSTRFTESNEVRIDINSVIADDGNSIVISIADYGRGVSEAQKELIFERISKKKDGFWGTGIGLTLARSIIDYYEGELWVEDRISGNTKEGVKFLFKLPLKMTDN